MDHVRSKIVVVDGYRYLVSHANPEQAWEIGIELLKMIGGSAAAMASVDEKKPDSIGTALSGAVNMLLSKVHPKESMALIKRILINVEVQGEEDAENNKKRLLDPAGINDHFRGRVGSMIKLVGAALEFTHADFFEAISDGVATMMKRSQEKASA